TLEAGFGNSLVDGAVYSIVYNATDAAGNPATTVTNTNIIYDVSPPTSAVTITSSTYGLNTFIATSTIHGTASDANGIASVTVTLQGSGCDSPGGYWSGSDWGTVQNLPTTYDSGSGTWVYDATGLTQTCGPNFTITPTATDVASNSAVGTVDSFVFDNTLPTISIGLPSVSSTSAGPVTYLVTYGDPDGDSDVGVISLSPSDVTLIATGNATGTISSITGASLDRTINISNISGDGTLGISISPSTSQDLAGNFDLGTDPSVTFVVDNTRPTITITNDQSVTTNIAAGNILYTFNFSEPVTGFASGDIVVGNGTKGIFSAVSSTQYTQVVTPDADFEGNLTVDVAQDMAFDAANNGNATATQYVWTIDTLAPIITSTTPIDNAYIKADFSSTYSLSQDVASGTISFINTSGTVDGATHIYNLSGGDFSSGSHSISQTTLEAGFGNSLVDGAVYSIVYNAADAAGNPAITVTNAGIIFDNTLPTVSISSSSVSLTATSSVTYTITYFGADNVTLSDVDVTLNFTGSATADYNVTGTGTSTRLVTVLNISGNGTLGISIPAGTSQDLAGNLDLGTDPSVTFVVDNTRPTSTIGGFLSTIRDISRNQLVTITYSESMNPSSTPVIGFSGGSFTSSATGSWSFSNTIWQQTFTDSADEEVAGVTITSSGATDIIGNLEFTNFNGSNNPFNIDTVVPTISISSSSASLTATTSVTYTVTYSGADSVTLSNVDITLNTTDTATADYDVTGSGTSTRLVTLSNITGDGTLGISVAAATASDVAGNDASDAGPSGTFTVDNTSPATPVAIPVAGTYNSTQNISLSSIGSTDIYYTTDGSAPSCSVGTLYSGAFSVSVSETVNVIGCDSAGNGSLASFVYTIVAPTVAPTIPSVSGRSVPVTPPIVLSPPVVVGGASSDSQNIILNFFVKNALQVAISEDPTFSKTSWVTYDPSKQFVLSNNFGGKIVYVKFRSKDGGVTETFKVDVNFVKKSSISPITINAVSVFEVINPDSKITIVPVKKLQYAPNSLVNYTYQYKNESNKTIKIKVLRQIIDINGKVVNKANGSTSIIKNKIFKYNARNTINSKVVDGVYTVHIKIMDAKSGNILEENGFNITVKKPIVVKKAVVSSKKNPRAN
ncbi:MAG: hemagglutinin/hemolysin-related protein, partial [uncultured bacterium]